MRKTNWVKLLADVSLKLYEHEPPVEKPSAKAIREFERSTGFILPKSYCDFIQVFGPGEVGECITIAGPGYLTLGNTYDLKKLNQEGPVMYMERGVAYVDPDQIRRMVFFGETIGSDFIGWDPIDVSDQPTNEYGIYLLPHANETASRIAENFTEFIQDIAMGPGISQITLMDFENPIRKVFKPARRG